MHAFFYLFIYLCSINYRGSLQTENDKMHSHWVLFHQSSCQNEKQQIINKETSTLRLVGQWAKCSDLPLSLHKGNVNKLKDLKWVLV